MSEDGMERFECPACRFEIAVPGDHEPQCANGDWDRDDVIDWIMKEADRQNAEAKEAEKRHDRLQHKHEMYGSGWPR